MAQLDWDRIGTLDPLDQAYATLLSKCSRKAHGIVLPYAADCLETTAKMLVLRYLHPDAIDALLVEKTEEAIRLLHTPVPAPAQLPPGQTPKAYQDFLTRRAEQDLLLLEAIAAGTDDPYNRAELLLRESQPSEKLIVFPYKMVKEQEIQDLLDEDWLTVSAIRDEYRLREEDTIEAFLKRIAS